MFNIKSKGTKKEPCGTPHSTRCDSDRPRSHTCVYHIVIFQFEMPVTPYMKHLYAKTFHKLQKMSYVLLEILIDTYILVFQAIKITLYALIESINFQCYEYFATIANNRTFRFHWFKVNSSFNSKYTSGENGMWKLQVKWRLVTTCSDLQRLVATCLLQHQITPIQ